MRYVELPGTDLNVSQLALGCGNIGGPIPVPESLALLDEYLALGGNFIDTAHVYSNWVPGTYSVSEKTIGQWMKDRGTRDQLVLATKGAHPELATMHIARMSHADIAHDIAESLDFLQTDVIDLYWLHRDAPGVPVGEIIDALNEQVKAGTIRYFGASNWPAARIQAALDYATERKLDSFVANQAWWSLAEINVDLVADKTVVPLDAEGIAFHKRTGMALMPFSPQANGFFSKLDNTGIDSIAPNKRLHFENPTNVRRLERIREVARRYDTDINAVVLAYLLAQPLTVIPVIGPRDVEQLRSSVKALDIALTPDDLVYLESA